MTYNVTINRPGQRAQSVNGITRARMLALTDHVLRLEPEAQVTIVRKG